MVTVPLLEPPVTRWVCPSCGLTDSTRVTGPHTQMHPCPVLGIIAPMLMEGTKGKHVLNVREDYEGTDEAQRDRQGRAIMSVQTVRDDGEDCTVLAPVAVGSGDDDSFLANLARRALARMT